MGMYSSFFGAFEVSRLETFTLFVLSTAAPFLILFALYTFAAAIVIYSYREINHARLISRFHGHRRAGQVRCPDV